MTCLATGDTLEVATATAHAAGITDVQAELMPAGKSALVGRLRRERGPVAMVGDASTTRQPSRPPTPASLWPPAHARR
jgi:cation transport ATPase